MCQGASLRRRVGKLRDEYSLLLLCVTSPYSLPSIQSSWIVHHEPLPLLSRQPATKGRQPYPVIHLEEWRLGEGLLCTTHFHPGSMRPGEQRVSGHAVVWCMLADLPVAPPYQAVGVCVDKCSHQLLEIRVAWRSVGQAIWCTELDPEVATSEESDNGRHAFLAERVPTA